MQKQVLIFDFDGTLIDSMGGFTEIAAEVMARHFGCSFDWGREQYKKTSGLPFPFQLEQLFPLDSRNAQAVCEFNEQKRKYYEHCNFYDDCWKTLSELKKLGLQLAVSSNNDQEILNDRLGEQKQFFDIVLGYRPGFLKGRDHFRWIEHRFNDDRSQMHFVGDSLHDAVVARENQIPFIAKVGTFEKQAFADQGIAMRTIVCLSQLIQFYANCSISGRYRKQTLRSNYISS